MAKAFQDLTPSELLALAISLEEDDARIYASYAKRLDSAHAETIRMLETMAEEERGHAARLTALHEKQFGTHVPLVRRHDVRGFLKRKPLWLAATLSVAQIRDSVEEMEVEALRFYESAAKGCRDEESKALLTSLAAEEQKHEKMAGTMRTELAASGAEKKEDEAAKRLFVLQVVQPGLAGLMDGSVSTLAPVFAAAVATKDSGDAFLVGLAASIGAGISMGFAEALSDDGVISGRGRPWARGTVCGFMTALGGVGHTLPFLIADFRLAMMVAIAVVVVELAVIAWIRHKYMDTPLLAAAFQVVVGGVLVFLTGIWIGSS
jgi:rubrerythrin